MSSFNYQNVAFSLQFTRKYYQVACKSLNGLLGQHKPNNVKETNQIHYGDPHFR